MSDNLIAIFLYVGIMLMAATVLVLTIIYFVRPNSAKKAGIAEIQPGAKKNKFTFRLIKAKSQKKEKITPIINESKSISERKTITFPAIKMKLIKSKTAAVKHEPKKNTENVKPVAASVEQTSPEKLTITGVERPNQEIHEVPIAMANTRVNPEDKEP